jgi:hypothetical protein
MAEQQYQGGCHCGGLRYEVDLDLDKGSLRCNCSLCGKSRAWFAFAPAEKFTLTSGEGAEIRYRWTPPNRPEPNLTYQICSMCGVRTHAEGRDPKAVQVATLEGADPEVLARGIRYVDGRHDRFGREPENTAAL